MDKFFAPSEFEFDERYRGLALLRQALYFYMEPAHSKILRNRSTFNHSHGVNGKPGEVCWELHSQFNPDLRLPLWSLQNFKKKLLSLTLDSVALHPRDSFLIVLNLRLYLRNNLQEYLTNSKESFYLFLVCDDTDSPIFSLQLIFEDFNLDWVRVWFSILVKTPSGVVISQSLVETFEMGEPLSVESVQVFIRPKSLNVVDLHLQILRANTAHVKLEKMGHTLPSTQFRTLYLGDPLLEESHSHPPFVVHLLDLLVFEGGYFLTDPKHPGDMRMVSVDTLEVLHCPGNATPSRFSGNPSLDSLHRKRLATSTSCRDLLFNSDCTFTNCELCGDSECLVCEEGFVLINKACEASLDPIDPLSRLALSGLGVSWGSEVVGRVTWNEVKTQAPTSGLSLSIFSKTIDSQNLLPWSVDFNFGSVSCFLVTENTIDQRLREALFGMGDPVITNRFYYPVSKNENKVRFLGGNESFTMDFIQFPHLCHLDLASFVGNFALQFCPDKLLDFSGSSFFPEVFPISQTINDDQYLSYPAGSQNVAIINPCRNNCKCGKGTNIH